MFDKRVASFVGQLDGVQGPAASCYEGIKFGGGVDGASQRRCLRVRIHIKIQKLAGGQGSKAEKSVVKTGQIV